MLPYLSEFNKSCSQNPSAFLYLLGELSTWKATAAIASRVGCSINSKIEGVFSSAADLGAIAEIPSNATSFLTSRTLLSAASLANSVKEVIGASEGLGLLVPGASPVLSAISALGNLGGMYKQKESLTSLQVAKNEGRAQPGTYVSKVILQGGIFSINAFAFLKYIGDRFAVRGIQKFVTNSSSTMRWVVTAVALSGFMVNFFPVVRSSYRPLYD